MAPPETTPCDAAAYPRLLRKAETESETKAERTFELEIERAIEAKEFQNKIAAAEGYLFACYAS
ncbi:hypothetical protein SGI37_20020, partial [Providencia rettgeri]